MEARSTFYFSSTQRLKRLTLFLIRIIRVLCNELSVAGCLVVFLGHKDDAVFTLNDNKNELKVQNQVLDDMDDDSLLPLVAVTRTAVLQ